MNSFARVIQRHEREALLHHPSAWDPLYHVEKATNGSVRRALSTASVAFNPYRAKSTVELLDEPGGPELGRPSPPHDAQRASQIIADNPFEDFVSVSKPAPESAPFVSLNSDEIELFEERRPVSATSWNSRDYNFRPPSVPVSFSSNTRESYLSWESQIKPRNPKDNVRTHFSQPRSPESKYSSG